MGANLITTKNKAISCVSGESKREFKEAIEAHEKVVGSIVLGSAAKLMVLTIVLREMKKLKVKEGNIGFDFGGKKEFQLKRVK